ncbi:SDR family NAD(P)-dependent oxidoreductase [Pseudoalteromonas xiamenensis]|uniref:SDR family NAD(P)-dependent oxidoreductase n=1 Tax=Pseudoalteromonas xiamenensis TaxID=882626 RepID=UPI0027E51165|nr:SDR family NAD(P)-dependent oxidoreductase [Pseudoalteromonas xiamenensis]WMN58581.1 SDR family NAD(P)-dependent oxidoreductase [Pseudoalteromonas xiamenensis]
MKYVLITGASSGIGLAMSHEFAQKGHNLIIVARSEDKLLQLKQSLISEYGIDVQVKAVDLSISGAAQSLYDQCKKFEVEVLINNAGFGDFSNIWDMNLEKAENMLNLNVNALTMLSLNYVRDYHDKPATLINVASIGGYKMFPTAVTYCATKFFVSAFTEGIAEDLKVGNKQMKAKVLAPAATATDFFNQAYTNAGLEAEAATDRSQYTPASVLADYTYQLYQSDQVVGYVENEQLILQGPKFDFVANKL